MQKEVVPAPQLEGTAPPKPPPSTSHNDSGYTSVLTSPECSRECSSSSSSQQVSTAPDLPSHTPGTAKVTSSRLTSTPHARSSQDVFCLPLPKIDSIIRVGRSRYNSTTDSPIIPTTTTTTITTPTSMEMQELEVTSEAANDEKPHRAEVKSRTPHTPTRKSISLGSKILPSRSITRLRKPQSAFVCLMNEADYLLRHVLKYLKGNDLVRLSHVNRQLRDLILNDKLLGSRRKMYLRAKKKRYNCEGKEDVLVKRLNEGSSMAPHATLSPRKLLSSIQNICSANTSTARSPEKVIPLAERFMEKGKSLAKGEELQKCVKCKSPALVQRTQQRATCSRKMCGYDYCTNCHLPHHRRPQDCPLLRPRTRQATGIFSSRCKKNLRRL